MKRKLKRYTKEEVLSYWQKLLADRKTKKPAQSALMDWVDEGGYKFSKP